MVSYYLGDEVWTRRVVKTARCNQTCRKCQIPQLSREVARENSVFVTQKCTVNRYQDFHSRETWASCQIKMFLRISLTYSPIVRLFNTIETIWNRLELRTRLWNIELLENPWKRSKFLHVTRCLRGSANV